MGFRSPKSRGGGGGRGGNIGGVPIRLIIVGAFLLLGWLAKEGKLGPFGDFFERGSRSSDKGGDYSKDNFVRLDGARLVSTRGNDGDSFLVKHQGKEYHLRLYYVDCPEKYMDNRNEKRVGDQAGYFNCSKNDAIEAGLDAKDMVKKLLSGRDFTVYTHWETVYDSDRYYGFVALGEEGSRDYDFVCERLVDVGLARIHTKGVDTPDGHTFYKFRDQLRDREKQAKRANAGAWAH